MSALDSIAASTSDVKGSFRELSTRELTDETFSDYFRFSFTMRMDRDDALALARKVEVLVSEAMARDCRVYVGVSNHGGVVSQGHGGDGAAEEAVEQIVGYVEGFRHIMQLAKEELKDVALGGNIERPHHLQTAVESFAEIGHLLEAERIVEGLFGDDS